MLLKVKGIDVNNLVSIMIPTCSFSPPLLALPPLLSPLPLTSNTICVVCLSFFHLQSPLQVATGRGKSEIVALLLQAEGIDVNQEVSIMISTPTLPKHVVHCDLLLYSPPLFSFTPSSIRNLINNVTYHVYDFFNVQSHDMSPLWVALILPIYAARG